MAIPSVNGTNRGRPSSWSAAIDQLAYGHNFQRLFVVSTGNIRQGISRASYPTLNDIEPVENPAQAWNALAVGAYTEKQQINDLRPDIRGQVDEVLHDTLFDKALRETLDEEAVHLDEVRLQFTDEPHIGEAHSHIVKGELHAFLQKWIEHPEKIRSVRYRIMLGKFQNDLDG
jgi:hypothetical protein